MIQRRFINATLVKIVLLVVLFSTCTTSVAAEVESGKAAPSFELMDSDNKVRSLNEFAGKIVVLEWLNHGCPYVRKHYESGNMQSLQATYTSKGVIWLSIASSAEGKEGYMTAQQSRDLIASKKSNATAVLLDPEGKVGRAYSAKTTPHMFIIDTQGKLAYQGAIDDQPSTRVSSIEGAKNYVAQALDEMLANKAISTEITEAYGCSIKYKN